MSIIAENAALLAEIEMTGPDDSLLERWRTVARSLTNEPALISPGANYTFGETDALSDAVARVLINDFVDDGSPIGALLGHNARALIGFLAIVKAGRVVVVLDPHLPSDRLRDIMQLAGISSVLVDEASLPAIAALDPGVTIHLDELITATESTEPNLAFTPAPIIGVREGYGQDALSIIFTSGSTGKPKGVIHSHAQLLNDAAAHGRRCALAQGERIAFVMPIGFSAGLTLLIAGLLNGASLWMFDPRDGGTRGLINWINDNQLTTLHCTPHLLRAVSEMLASDSGLPSLRLVATVGEPVYGPDVDSIRQHLTMPASFFNWTGSSETGTFALHEIDLAEIGSAADLPSGAIPAGRPTLNKEIRLLRADGTPTTPGEAGEVMIFSEYLSGGYLGDADGNELRFTVDSDGRRGCRQGDLATVDEKGNFELLGRADSAVKVRGYLVEPSEVERAFLATGLVQEVVVVAVSNPSTPTRLAAYLAPRPGIRPPSAAALRRELRLLLPEYMVPRDVVQLEALPRNERGKIDRSALPPVPARVVSTEEMDQWQLVIAGIWTHVLELPTIDLDDDFMALGGDSLSTEELLTIVKDQLAIPLVTSDLIEFPTLREFARRLKHGKSALPSHPDVVTLRADGAGTPMFCFAGSGALALTFFPLSRHFTNRAIYAFQAHGIESRALPDWSVEASARRFLQIMRVVQPHGPYNLVGHSFGGLVALEVARQLTEAGEQVELVTLLDTYFPRSHNPPPEQTFAFLDSVPRLQNKQVRSNVMSAILQRMLPDGLPQFRLLSRRIRGHLAGMLVQPGQRQFDAFFDHGTIVSRRYVVRPYSGRTIVVIANKNPDEAVWNRVLTGDSSFVHIACEHSSLLREPQATGLSVILQTELSSNDRSLRS